MGNGTYGHACQILRGQQYPTWKVTREVSEAIDKVCGETELSMASRLAKCTHEHNEMFDYLQDELGAADVDKLLGREESTFPDFPSYEVANKMRRRADAYEKKWGIRD